MKAWRRAQNCLFPIATSKLVCERFLVRFVVPYHVQYGLPPTNNLKRIRLVEAKVRTTKSTCAICDDDALAVEFLHILLILNKSDCRLDQWPHKHFLPTG